MACRGLSKRTEVIKDLSRELQSEFEDKFDNSSESWQESERGEACLENIDACQRALDAMDEIS